MSGFERHLTDAALADRLRRIVAKPRSWPPRERDAFLLEAARRLEETVTIKARLGEPEPVGRHPKGGAA